MGVLPCISSEQGGLIIHTELIYEYHIYLYKNFELKRGWAYNTSWAYNTYYTIHMYMYTTCTCINLEVVFGSFCFFFLRLLQVWDACSDARVVFDNHGPSSSSSEDTSSDYIIHSSGLHGEETPVLSNLSTLGYVVEDRVMMAALGKVVEGCEGVELVRGTRVTEVKHQSQEVHVCRVCYVLESVDTVTLPVLLWKVLYTGFMRDILS